MVTDWVQHSLGELVEVKHGFAFSGQYIRDMPTENVLLTPGNFAIRGGFKSHKFKYYDGPIPEDFLLPPGELLVTMTDLSKSADTLGYPAVVPASTDGLRFLHNQRLGRITVQRPDALDKGYLYYLLCSKSYRDEVLASATGTTVKHTSPSRIGRFRFSLPPLKEQRAIAIVLGSLDDKLELSQQRQETLMATARALFRSWFIDFDPVHSKIKGSELSLPEAVAGHFPGSLEISSLGQIPTGWTTATVADLCSAIFSGGTPSTQEARYWDGDIPWLSSGETANSLVIDTDKRITSEGVANSSTRAAPRLSTVVASAGQGSTRGQTALLGIPCYVNQSIVVLSANNQTSSPLHLFFDLERRYEEFRRVSDGHSSRGSLTTRLLAGLGAVLPPMPLVHLFEATNTPIIERAIVSLQEARTLVTLRDTLLPKLISGELRIRNAERLVSDAV